MNQRILSAVVILLGMLTTQNLLSQCDLTLPEGACDSPVTSDPFWASSGLPGESAANPIMIACESEIDDYLFNGTGPSGATYTAVDVDPGGCPASNSDPTTLCSTRPTTADYCSMGAFFVEVISYDNDGFRSRSTPVHGVYFQVTDNTPPTFTAPANITIGTDAPDNADCPAAATVVGITAGGGPYPFGMAYTVGGVSVNAPDTSLVSDHCGGTITLDVVSIVDDPTPPNSCSQDKVITWVIEDACGNTTQAIQRITIVDNQPPNFLKVLVTQNLTTTGGAQCPSTLSAASVSIAQGSTVVSGSTYTVAGLSFIAPVLNSAYSDDCNTVTLVLDNIAVTQHSCAGSIVLTWRYTDLCGNVRFNSQTFNISDDEAPTITPAGANQTLSCDGTPINPTASNTCNPSFPIFMGVPTATSPAGLYYVDVAPPGSCVHNSTVTRTWQATNGCGNLSTTFDQMITFSDTEAPTFTVPANVSANNLIQCQSDNDFDPLYLHGLNPAFGFPTDLMDNCSDPEALVNDDYIMGSNSWTTDEGYTVSYSDNYTCFNCTGSNNQTILITRSWTVTDECGNVSNALTQNIWINDNTAPTISGITDLGTLQITDVGDACPDNTGLTSAFTYDGTNLILTDPLSGNVNSFTAPTVTDNCDLALIDCNDLTILRIANVGVNTMDPCAVVYSIEWEAEDECGNITPAGSRFVQTLTITDEAAPVWNIAAGSLSTSANCMDNLAPIPLGGTVIAPAVADLDENCGVNAAYFAVTKPPTSLSVSGLYYIDGVAGACVAGVSTFTRIWYAVDECGNVSVPFTQSITITDNVGPTFVSPATPISVQTSNGANCPDPNNPTGMISLTTGTVASGATFTVAGVTYTAPTESTNPMMFGQYGGDACDSNPVLSITSITSTGSPTTCQVNVAVTWRVTDNCGNFTERVQTFVITDNEAPTLTGLTAQTINLTDINGSCPSQFTSASFAYDDVNNQLNVTDPVSGQVYTYAGPTISDDCQTKNTISMNPGNISFSFFKTAVCQSLLATVVWTAEDCCGNTATFNQNFTITDKAVPVATTAAIDATVSGCHTAAVVGQFTYSYNAATGLGTVIYNDGTTSTNLSGAGDAQFTENCEIETITLVSVALNSTTGCSRVFDLTYSATDECMNTTPAVSQFVQQITVTDDIDPVFTATPANQPNLDCTPDLNAYLAQATATDNCATPTITVADVVTNPSANGCGTNALIIERTYTASDGCTNTATHVQTLTITDNDPPTITTFPANVTVCPGAIPAVDLSAVVATDGASCNTSVTISHVGDVLVNPTATACAGSPRMTERTYRATDGCGNFVDQTQTITELDETAPTFTAPANITISMDGTCNYDASVAITGDVINEADNCGVGQATFADVLNLNACGGTGTITRTWMLTDNCGNAAANQVQIITVQDNTAPVLSAPASATVSCASANVTAWVNSATATDNCSATTIQANATSVPSGCSGTGTYIYEFTATDACANTTSVETRSYTVVDNTGPAWTSFPLNMTLECGSNTTPANTGTPTASDNCGGTVTINHTDAIAMPGCPGFVEVITRTWTATDPCGNTISQDQIINLDDTTPPIPGNAPSNGTAVCTGGSGATSLATWLANFAGATATDGCNSVSLSANQLSVPTGCTTSGCYEYEFFASDGCNPMVSLGTAEFCITDNVAPVFDVSPMNMTVECDGSGNTAAYNNWRTTHAGAMASDNCGNVTITNVVVSTVNPCDGSTVYTVNFTATDDCGLSVTEGAIFTIQDTGAPTITCPANQALACTASTLPADTGSATATDLCDGNPTITFADVSTMTTCVETITRTWTATDDCGNTDDCVQTITLTDSQMPIPVSQPSNETATCNGNGNPTALNTWLNNNGGMVVTDDCGNITWSNSVVGTINNCGNTSITTYEFTATDQCGNATSAQATFTVIDNVSPSITTQATNASGGCNGMGTWIANNGNAVATDNCGTVTWSAVQTNQTTCNAGTMIYTYQFTAMDDCGNTANTSATFTAIDNTPPTFTSPPTSMVVECDGNGNHIQLNAWLVSFAGAAATDACSNVILDDVFVSETPQCGDTETITYNFTATDDCGNVTSQTAQFIIQDTGNPTITPPANVTVSCENANLAGWLGTASSNDMCGATSVNATLVNYNPTCPQAGVHIYEFYAQDACGNQSVTVTATYTITDNVAPVITNFPATVTVSCGDDTSPTALGTPTANDNCDNSFNTNFNDVVTTPGCPGFVQVINRTWTISDDCGNSVNQIQVINVEDDVDPVMVTAPSSMTVNCDGSGNTNAFNTWLNTFAGAAATDACTSASLSANQLFAPTSCSGSGCYEYEFFATDDCNNQISLGTAQFCINDMTPPVISPTASNMTVECDGSGNSAAMLNWLNTQGGAVATDGCSNVTWSLNTLSDINPCPGERLMTVEFTATDICGNANTTTATFTIEDTQAPSITCPANMTNLQCGADTSPTGTGAATATDNCDNNPTVNFADVASNVGCVVTITRTWATADACGNTDNCVQTIILDDTTPPTVDTEPSNLTVECDGSGNATDFVNWVTNNGGMVVSDACNTFVWSSAVITQTPGCNSTIQTTVVEFTATDACNNAVSRQASFIIEDTTPPNVITVPANASIDCSAPNPIAQRDAWVATIGGAVANDICGSVTWTSSLMSTTGSCALLGADYTYEFTATDDCGNAVTHTATFSVSDNTAPFFNMLPQSTSVECDGAGNTAALNAWLASNASAIADDACSTVSISAAATGLVTNGCGGSSSAQYEFTATDNCGNTAFAFAFFTTNDTTDPTISTGASNITMTCGGNFAAQKQAWLDSNGGAAANDICGSVTWSNVLVNTASSGCTNFPAETYQFIASDDCGNTAVTTATLVFTDNTPPTFAPAPQDLNVQCGPNNILELATWLVNNGNALATDDCSNVSITYMSVGTTGTCGGYGAETYEFTATDDCGNATTATATFTVFDNTDPTILAQASDGSGSCNGLTNWLSTNGGATASDNCGSVTWNQIVVSASACNGGSVDYLYEFQATDGCGNTASTFANFTATDFDAPFFSTNPMDMTVECDGAGNTAELNNWLTTNAGAVAEDACNNATINQTLVTDIMDCGNAKTITYSFVATDDCGNSSPTQTAQFVIEDTTDPMLLTPATDANVQCGITGAGSKAQWVNTYGGATVSEACGTVTWSSVVTSSVANCANGGALVETYEFTATDDCGNSVTTTATVTAVDNTPPVYTTAPMNMTVQCDGNGNHFALKAWLGNHGGGIASDDCSAVQYGTTDQGITNACGSAQTHNYLFHAVDMCGNRVEATAQFIIQDNAAPTILVQASSGTGDCNAFQTWLNANGGAAATDNCGLVTWTANVVSQSAACVNGELTYNYLFVAEDDCNNSTSSTASFTVTDTDVPVFTTFPANMVVECDGTGNTADLATWLTNHAGAVATDACNMVTITNALTNTTNVCGSANIYEYTFTATDDCGNAVSETALFTIEDTTLPVLITPAADATVTCGGTGAGSKAAWLSNYGGAVVTEGCNAINWTTTLIGASSTCIAGNLTETYQFTATDECNNSVSTTATVTSVDNSGPMWTTQPSDMIFECDGSPHHVQLKTWLANNGNGVATDDCSAVLYGETLLNPPTSGCGNTLQYDYRFHVTDLCGNTTEAFASFIVQDNTPPNILAQANSTSGDCNQFTTWLAGNGGAAATDACGVVTWSNSATPQSTICIGGAVTYNVTFTAEDECGNTAITTATYSVVDNVPPAFVTMPLSTSVECDGTGNLTDLTAWLTNNAGATATDNCSVVNITTTAMAPTVNCGNATTQMFEFTATDGCGNAVTAQASFVITDTTDPVLTTPATDASVQCGITGAGSKQAWLDSNGGATATDACNSVTWTYVQMGVASSCVGGSITETYQFTATDDCGNATTTSAVVTSVDNSGPVFTTPPADMIVECDGSGHHFQLKTWLANKGGAVAMDDCGTVVLGETPLTPTPGCGNSMTYVYQFHATDFCGNQTNATASFIIQDTQAPTIFQQAQNGSGDCNSLNTWLAANGGAAAGDACGLVNWTHTITSQSATCVNGAVDYVVNFAVADDCGNVANTIATYSVIDNLPPVFTSSPQNMTVECDGAGNTADLTAWIGSNAGAVATDNCSLVTMSQTPISNIATCGNATVHTYEFTASDGCGNPISAQATFTIEDTTPPTLITPAANASVICGSTGFGSKQTWLDSNGGATATDLCNTITWTYVQIGASSGCIAGALTETYEFTATDACSNSVTTTAVVTSTDNAGPTFTTQPSDMIVECDGNGNLADLGTWLNGLAGAVAADDCSTPTVFYNPLPITTGCGSTQTRPYEFTATDACGNTTTVTASFIIQDNTNPTIFAQAQNGSGDCNAFTAWMNANGGAAIADNCGLITWSHVVLSQSPTCVNGSLDYSIRFIATDDCGNSVNTVADYTVVDNDVPVWATLPSSMTVECGATNATDFNNWLTTNAGAAATDACNMVTITAALITDTPACGNTSTRLYEFTATDDCGNAVSAQAAFIIEDTTDPILVVPATAATVTCGGTGAGSKANWLATNGGAIATEACGNVTWTHAMVGANSGCAGGGNLTETYAFTATDDCGNAVTTTATVTSVDNAGPVWTTAPQNMNIECNGTGNHFQLKTWLQANGNGVATDDCSSVVYGSTALTPTTSCGGTVCYPYQFHATDLCGNQTPIVATFCVVDNTPPTLFASANNFTGDCNGLNAWVNNNGNAVAGDACGGVTWSSTLLSQTSVCINNQLTHTYQFTATDDCGNFVSTTATYTMLDNLAPTFTLPPLSTSVECDGNSNVGDLNAWLANNAGATATDACGTVTMSYAQINNFAICGNSQTVIYEFTATDDCGNASTMQAQFTILDTTDPILSIPASNITVDCSTAGDLAKANWIANNGGANASDLCNNVTWTSLLINTSGGCTNGGALLETYLFTATDNCGNSVSTTATASITDTTPPVFTTLPQDMTIECSSSSNYHFPLKSWLANNANAIATDDCSATVVTYTLLKDTILCTGTSEKTYQFDATDICGNKTFATAKFEIVDTTPPTLHGQAQNSNGNCNQFDKWLNANGGAAATDACGFVSWKADLVSETGCAAGVNTLTYNFTATDHCGNSVSSQAWFRVLDNDPPTLVSTPPMTINHSLAAGCPSQIDVNRTYETTPGCWTLEFKVLDMNGVPFDTLVYQGPCATDLCGYLATPIVSIANVAADNCSSTWNVGWRFMDRCGNYVEYDQVYNFNDNMAPAWVGNNPLNLTAECDDNIAAIIAANIPSTNDECSSIVSEVNRFDIPGACANSFTTVVEYESRDLCGNINPALYQVRINITDTTDPVWASGLNLNLTQECSQTGFISMNAWINSIRRQANVSDNCDNAMTFVTNQLSFTPVANCGHAGTYVYEFNATDNCGNTATITGTYILQDNSSPTITVAAQDTVAYCTNAGLSTWLANNGHATATDGCGGTISWTNALMSTTTDACGNDTFTYEFTASDGCGNSATTTALFIMDDDQDPTLVGVPADATVSCGQTVPAAATVTATDFCDNSPVVTFSESVQTVNSGGVSEIITRTWTATDCDGNAVSDSQEITVIQGAPPAVTFCPSDIGPLVSQNGGCVVVNWTLPTFQNVQTVTSTHNPGDCFPIGVTTVVYTATDACGAQSTCEFDIEIVDYCHPTSNCADFYIHEVTINGMTNTSGNNNGYANFTNLNSTFIQGQTAYMTLKPGGPNGVDPNLFGYWRVWFDYDGDGDFYDAGELVAQVSGTGMMMIQINIPNSATLGVKRMRVAFHHFGFPDPCDALTGCVGEMEDYTIYILPPRPGNGNDKETDVDGETTPVVTREFEKEFVAEANEEVVDLRWTTNFNQAIDYFIVERSNDGVDFTEVMVVENRNNNANELMYKTKDKYPLSGESFYRLKTILHDDGVDYSKIQKVVMDMPSTEVVLSPNPTKGMLFITMPAFAEKSGKVLILNQLGQIAKRFEIESIENRQMVDIRNLPEGIYNVVIVVGDMKVTKKVILQK